MLTTLHYLIKSFPQTNEVINLFITDKSNQNSINQVVSMKAMQQLGSYYIMTLDVPSS